MTKPVIEIKVGLSSNGRQKLPIRTTSPTVRQLLEVMDERRISFLEMSATLGISPNCFGRWRYGQSMPDVFIVEAWAEALGFSMKLVSNDERP